jgi:acyl-CoA synthetase (AMP-forming)/AMP-acid ligase II
VNIAGRLVERLAEWGDRIAIREPNGRTIGYAELRRRVLGFAETLKEKGFRRGDPAVIQVPNGIALAISALGIGLLGGSMVLAEPGFGDELYLQRIRSVGSRWTIVHPIVLWANRIPGARALFARRGLAIPPVPPDTAELRRVVLKRRVLRRRVESGAELVADVPPESDLAIIFTSGSTSEPKGVRLSHASVEMFMASIATFAREAGGRSLIADNPQHLLYGLMFGYEVLVTRGRLQRRAAMVRRMIDEGAGAHFGAPYLWLEMMEQAGPNPPTLPATLKAVFLGGAPVTVEFIARLKTWLHPETKIIALYGATEVGPVAWTTAEEKLGWRGEGDYVGRVLPDKRVEITESGEVIVKGQGLFTGYVGHPPLGADEGFATGDIGRLADVGGRPGLVLLGRGKDMIIRAGVNIYPSTLEGSLRAMTDGSGGKLLREAVLVGLWNAEKQDEEVVLCWQPHLGATVSEAELMKRATVVTGESAKPDHLMKVETMPTTGRLQKIDKGALRKMAAERFGLSVTLPGQSRR